MPGLRRDPLAPHHLAAGGVSQPGRRSGGRAAFAGRRPDRARPWLAAVAVLLTAGSVTAETTFAEQAAAVRSGAATRIRVADRALADDEWETLAGLDGLVWLDLQEGIADDARATVLARLPRLERLVLRRSPLSDEGLGHLAARHTLRDLNLPQARCTRAGLAALAELPRLRNLRLGSPDLCPDGEGGAELATILLRFPALESLHLIDVPLGDEGLDALGRYDGLRNLYLDGAGISDAAWERYFALHPEVHVHVDQAHHDRDPNRHE